MTAPLALLLAVAAAYLAAHVAFDWLARRFLIVSAAEYLVLGILLGPQVSGVLGRPLLDSLAPVVTLALGWIAVIVGMQFELRRLIEIPARRFRIAFSESALTFVIVAGLEYFVLDWGGAGIDPVVLIAAATLGAMAVTSSGVGIAVASRVLGTRGPVVEQLELSSAVNGFTAIAIFGLLLCIHHVPLPTARPLTTTEWAVVSIALGVVGGALFHVFLGDTPETDRLFVALVGGIVLVSGAATYLRLSPLASGVFFGIVLVNTSTAPQRYVEALQRVEQPFYYILLLLGGAAWQPSRRAWLVAVALFVGARALSKIGSSRLVARANDALGELGPNWGRALLGQGRVALAIGVNVLHQDDASYRNLIFTAAVASILLTEFFSARLARSVVPWRETRPDASSSDPDGKVVDAGAPGAAGAVATAGER